MEKKQIYILVNYGGPRNLKEVRPFLESLLSDPDVIQTRMPRFLQSFIFKRIAKKQSPSLEKEYKKIGGKSQSFSITEYIARSLEKQLDKPVLTFHRYLTASHESFLRNIQAQNFDEAIIFPLLPQFSYSATGSIARWFKENLPKKILGKLRWIPSYASHKSYTDYFSKHIKAFLKEKYIKEEDSLFIFLCHGLPEKYVQNGDPYQKECEKSFHNVMQSLPKSQAILSYHTKPRNTEWIKPWTHEVVQELEKNGSEKKEILFVPLSFTMDQLQTELDIEEKFLPKLKSLGLSARRIPAFNKKETWIEAILQIMEENDSLKQNQTLVRT